MTPPCTECAGPREGDLYLRGRSRCRDCHNGHKRATEKSANAIAKARRRKDPEAYAKILSDNSRWRYGITHAQRDEILAEQGNVCAICGTDEPQGRGWVTDHDHSCCSGIRSCGNCVRGILCARCNFMLGNARDSVSTLISAINYLSIHSSKSRNKSA